MNILELFCGTKSFSNVATERGHSTLTVDINPLDEPDIICDVMDLTTDMILEEMPSVDAAWISPPCPCFSVAAISHNWRKIDDVFIPTRPEAEHAITLVEHSLSIIEELQPCYFVIENPRGILRKMPFMQKYQRTTVSYCAYGDMRMKPTDLWTNFLWSERPMCSPGDTCHEAAPCGSRTGTQGLKKKERSIVPRELCIEILQAMELNTQWFRGSGCKHPERRTAQVSSTGT